MEINTRRIMVTGATGGIGAAVVSALADRGARLVLVGRQVATLEALAVRVGGEAVVADLTEPADVERLADLAGGCDALVLNAGIPDGSLREVMAVNLLAPMQIASAFVAAPGAAVGEGAVVVTGSVAGIVATPGMSAYNASKFGLRGYTLSLAHACSGTSMSVTHLVVGYVRDAGMLVSGGGRPPRGIRTRAPGEVADAVVHALVHGPAEVWVAPAELRLAARAAGAFPRLAAPVLRRVGSGAWRSSGT